MRQKYTWNDDSNHVGFSANRPLVLYWNNPLLLNIGEMLLTTICLKYMILVLLVSKTTKYRVSSVISNMTFEIQALQMLFILNIKDKAIS